MTDPYLEPSRPSSRHTYDVEHRRVVAPVRSTPHPAVFTPVPQQRSAAVSKPGIGHELVGVKAHLLRMIGTAGHSWSTYEHDALMSPLQRFSKKIWGLLPAQIRQSKLLPGRSHSWQAAYFVILFAALLAIPAGLMIRSDLRAQRYVLSAATQRLVGNPVVTLDKQFKFDAKSNSYQYNPSAADGIKSTPDASGDNSLTIGGSKYYGVDLAAAAKKGQTYTDAQTKLSFSLTPQFGALDGKHIDGHVVYPIDGGQAVYTLKSNGLKEDVVLSLPTDSATLKYKLSLPADLQAKLMPDGSVGIYSADPSLFGNITYGSDKDQQSVQKARLSGNKTNLVFQIPAPIITESGKADGVGKASFKLDGDQLTVSATNLRNLSYPISIDPSVVINSASTFGLGNDDDGNAIITNGTASRRPLSSGLLNTLSTDPSTGSWTSGTSLSTALVQGGALAYNGYIYLVGGDDNTGTYATTVLYASLNPTTGAMGSWNDANAVGNGGSGSSFATPRNHAGTAVYNGYIYITGGASVGNNALKDVQFAKVNANGSLGAWADANTGGSAVSNYGGTRWELRAAAANNYLYVVGGCTGAPSACSGLSAVVAFAPIKANGMLGTWDTSSNATLPTGLRFMTVTVSNGTLYVLGGCHSAIACGGVQNLTQVLYGTIGANGVISSWGTATSLPVGSIQATAFAANGYLYNIGGNNASTGVATAYYAPIYANGSIGPWAATTSLSVAHSQQEGAYYNGYIYQVGGCNASGCSSSVLTSEYAKIDPVGPAGNYTTNATTFTTTRRGAQTVAYAGHLYVLGGDNGGAPLTGSHSVMQATIASDGSLGAFADTTNMPTGLTFFKALAYNGSMYLIGGCSSTYASCTTASNNVATVYQSAIAAAGTLGAWNAQTSFTTARYGLNAAIYNDEMYILGGLNGSTFISGAGNHSIQYHAIAADGTLSGAWTDSASNMPTGLAYFGATANAGYLYIVGGCTAGALTCSTVQATTYNAPITSGGDLASAPSSAGNSSFTTARGQLGFGVSNGMAYIAGGWNGTTYYSDTQYAPINSNGTIGTWTNSTTSVLANNAAGNGMAIFNGYLYSNGGYDGTTYYANTQYAPLNNGGGGLRSAFQSTTAFAHNRIHPGTVAYNGYLYVLGGQDENSSTQYNDVQYAPINADGTIGTWQYTYNSASSGGFVGGFTTTRAYFGTVAYNGYLYINGGVDSIGNALGDVQYAPINPNGTIGTWQYTYNSASSGGFVGGFTTARDTQASVANNGYLYVIGGADNSGNSLNDVQYAPINPNGTIGTWQYTYNSASSGGFVGGLLTAAGGDTPYVNNGYMYIVFTGDVSGNQLNNVIYAPVNPNGTIGTWQYTTSFNGHYQYFTTASYGGYLYILGGLDPTNLVYNDVQYAAFRSNGGLGNWQTSPTSTTVGFLYGSGIAVNGYLYTTGGISLLSGAPTDRFAQYTSLQTIARVAHYSRLVDLAGSIKANSGNDSQITRYKLSGTSQGSPQCGAGVSSSIAAATHSSTSFGSATKVGCMPFAAYVPSKSFGRYAYVNFMIDDSQSATFPDASQTSISEMDILFHGSPAGRLRGGQTLNNLTSGSSITNQLDTEGP